MISFPLRLWNYVFSNRENTVSICNKFQEVQFKKNLTYITHLQLIVTPENTIAYKIDYLISGQTTDIILRISSTTREAPFSFTKMSVITDEAGCPVFFNDIASLFDKRPDLIKALPKEALLGLSPGEMSRIWEHLPERLKLDVDVQGRLPCLEHYNRPEDLVHIDGPPPARYRCRICKFRKEMRLAA